MRVDYFKQIDAGGDAECRVQTTMKIEEVEQAGNWVGKKPSIDVDILPLFPTPCLSHPSPLLSLSLSLFINIWLLQHTQIP